uniref:Small fragment nuclease n=1 Tax=Gadus morhua TaxID=8049 RepID=A0A8C5C7Z0_GADMO
MCALSSSRFLCRRWGIVFRSSGAVFLSKINILQTKRSVCFHEIRTAPGRSSRVLVPVLSNNMSSNTSDAMSQRMVWVDLEMTGLDIEKDKIIEMACIITDSELNVLAEGPNLIINQPTELLDGMSDWCKEHHGKSGLTQSVKDSKISLQQAEYEFLSFIRQHTQPGQCPLAGECCTDRHIHAPFLLAVRHCILTCGTPPSSSLSQVTLCTPTRSSWTNTCPSSCTISTTGSSTSAPLRSFAGDPTALG